MNAKLLPQGQPQVGITALFGPVMTVPDSSGWWWNRHLSDTDPVCVEVHLWHREDGSVRGGSVSYGKSIHTLQAWQERGESPEWVKATAPWPNDQHQATASK